MMAPVFAALVYLGCFPDMGIVLAGVITVFSGYTAVYALNDIAGYKDDKKNIRPMDKQVTDLDSILTRHPLAQGVISLKSAAVWAGFWSVMALLGAWYLNPVCILIFLGGALLGNYLLLFVENQLSQDCHQRICKSRRSRCCCFCRGQKSRCPVFMLNFYFLFPMGSRGAEYPQ